LKQLRYEPWQFIVLDDALDAREHWWRQAVLGMVFAIMFLAFVLVGGPPRVASATFAGIAAVAALNLRRQRRDAQHVEQTTSFRWRTFWAWFVVLGVLLVVLGVVGMIVGAGSDGQYVTPIAVGVVVLVAPALSFVDI
jgi:hypothetical protein